MDGNRKSRIGFTCLLLNGLTLAFSRSPDVRTTEGSDLNYRLLCVADLISISKWGKSRMFWIERFIQDSCSEITQCSAAARFTVCSDQPGPARRITDPTTIYRRSSSAAFHVIVSLLC